LAQAFTAGTCKPVGRARAPGVVRSIELPGAPAKTTVAVEGPSAAAIQAGTVLSRA
jgi:hypothetical protein